MFIICQDFTYIISQFSQWLYEVTTITIPMFTDKERKVQGGWETCLRSSSKEVAEPRFKPKTVWLQAYTFKHHSHFFSKLISRQVEDSTKWEGTNISQASMGTGHCAWELLPWSFSITLKGHYYQYHLPPPLRWGPEKLSNMAKVTNLGSSEASL